MSVVPSGMASGLLERAGSLAALDELLAGVRSTGQGRLILVSGEAGVGKTALLRAFCDAHAGDLRILWGACEPLRTPHPLGPLADVARTTGGELGELVAAGARPHDVAGALVAELRSRPPTVLVVEDLHWADEATLDVVALLAPRIASAPALALGSFRDDEIDASTQLRFLLGELVRRPSRLKVERLSRAAVVELAAPHGLDGDELYRGTGGNPFFVTEVIAAGGEQVPETVRDAVLARAARLSAPARRLLEAVGVVPGQVEPWLLEAIAGPVEDRVDECLASGMLIAGRTDIAFRHELARLAIEDTIAPNRRLALHRAAIEALAARGGDDPDFARLAHHAEAAGDARGVLEWAPRAAIRAATSGAHREAAAQYARALRHAGELSPDLRAKLLTGRVEECRLSAQFEEAIRAQQEALDCYRRLGDRLKEGDALRSLSRLAFFAGRTEEGERAGAAGDRAARAAPARTRAGDGVRQPRPAADGGHGSRGGRGLGQPRARARASPERRGGSGLCADQHRRRRARRRRCSRHEHPRTRAVARRAARPRGPRRPRVRPARDVRRARSPVCAGRLLSRARPWLLHRARSRHSVRLPAGPSSRDRA